MINLLNKAIDANYALLSKASQIHQFADNVAKGKQDEAEAILQASNDKQSLLTTAAKFIDYSGRTFNCTAYEYAYWAKDTHMRRMLESHMDDDTKTHLLERVTEMEDTGLGYQQHGVDYQNPHYDMSFVLKNLTPDEFNHLKTLVGENNAKIQQATVDNYQTIVVTATEYEQLKKVLAQQPRPSYFVSFFYTSPAQTISDKLAFDFKSLITALDTYVTNYDSWDYQQQDLAWVNVGKAQRDVPAHVAQEYCRPDRSFSPRPEFDELTLPRSLSVKNFGTPDNSWFPLSSLSSGLGFDLGCTVLRNVFNTALSGGDPFAAGCGALPPRLRTVMIELEVVRHLDEVRTADLTQSRQNLDVAAPNHGFGLS